MPAPTAMSSGECIPVTIRGSRTTTAVQASATAPARREARKMPSERAKKKPAWSLGKETRSFESISPRLSESVRLRTWPASGWR
jgi:hypothetical protein